MHYSNSQQPAKFCMSRYTMVMTGGPTCASMVVPDVWGVMPAQQRGSRQWNNSTVMCTRRALQGTPARALHTHNTTADATRVADHKKHSHIEAAQRQRAPLLGMVRHGWSLGAGCSGHTSPGKATHTGCWQGISAFLLTITDLLVLDSLATQHLQSSHKPLLWLSTPAS